MGSRKVIWTGRVISALPVLLMVFSAVTKLMHAKMVLDMWEPHFGYPMSTLVPIGILELVCALLYAFPRTAVFGAAMVTAYLGGATATNVRVGDSWIMPVLVGVLVWVGLYLRE